MNDKRFNSILLLSILATLVALFIHPWLPQRHFLVSNFLENNAYINASTNADGSLAGGWVDGDHHRMRCNYREGETNFSCSLNIFLAGNTVNGVNISRYDRLELDIVVRGNAQRFRVYMRNYNPIYSREADYNSTKFNQIIIPTKDLQPHLWLDLSEFSVADWWSDQYQIPRQQSHPEFSNVLSLGVDFYYPLPPGIHELQINKMDFVGDWIGKENWYLLILGIWMLGIFIFAVYRLILLSRQATHDIHTINSLNRDRELLKRESEQFRQLSNKDALTGIYNRRGVEQILSSLFGSGLIPPPEQLVLILGDIDFFKRINDNRGHDVGDKVLQQVSQAMQTEVRTSDFLGRWGGEEFIILVPYEALDMGVAIAERIRLRVASQVFEPHQPLNVTISFGVGEIKPGEGFDELFKRVDEALYKAKTQGRNCTITAP